VGASGPSLRLFLGNTTLLADLPYKPQADHYEHEQNAYKVIHVIFLSAGHPP